MKYKFLNHSFLLQSVIIIYICKYCLSLPAKLVLHSAEHGEHPKVINGQDCPFGATFEESNSFSCACITGVWAFYDDKCQRPALIAAGDDNHCFRLAIKLHKAILLSSPNGDDDISSIAVFSKGMKLSSGRIVLQGHDEQGTIDAPAKDLSFITTGHSVWGVRKKSSSSCLKSEKQYGNNFYCSYKMTDDTMDSIHVNSSCEDDAMKIIKPLSCTPFLKGPGKCPFAPLVFSKRSIGPETPQGRFLMSGSKQMKNYTLTFENDNSTSNQAAITTTVDNAPIRNAAWNHILSTAQKMAGLREDREPKYNILAFKLLDICKRLIKNVCPDHYVKDIFYDIAISTFIGVQSYEFGFRETPIDYHTEKRITEALTDCLKNYTAPYPFFDRMKSYYNKTATKCKVEVGTFDIHDATDELTVAPNISSLSHDPIIDTAWQVFVHAHSACYDFFEQSDHHRFTTILMPLFTNEIHDIWYRGYFALKDEKDPYAGALGSMYSTMMFVDHCTQFSRLESKYPWDLVRPEKKVRRKRDLSDSSLSYQCMKDTYTNDCIT